MHINNWFALCCLLLYNRNSTSFKENRPIFLWPYQPLMKMHFHMLTHCMGYLFQLSDDFDGFLRRSFSIFFICNLIHWAVEVSLGVFFARLLVVVLHTIPEPIIQLDWFWPKWIFAMRVSNLCAVHLKWLQYRYHLNHCHNWNRIAGCIIFTNYWYSWPIFVKTFSRSSFDAIWDRLLLL